MLILKFNTLSSQDLFVIERQLVRWLDNKGPPITGDFNVLDLPSTELYGHLLGVFGRFELFDVLGASPSQLLDFLIDVDGAYLDSPYHSFHHAVDIVMMLYFMLTKLGASRHLGSVDTAALLLAALGHDTGHPGYNNLYQVNFKTALARRYNNTSVLENYSADITHDLLRKHGLLHRHDDLLPMVRKLILYTDMAYHYELQEQARSLEKTMTDTTWYDAEDSSDDTASLVFSEPSTSPNTASTLSCDGPHASSPAHAYDAHTLSRDDRQSLCRILLHAADISNTVRPWPISKQWSDLIVQEFFQQGDAEKEARLTISPGMDRSESSQPSIGLKFGDFVVKPYFEALAGILPAAQLFLDTLAANRAEWQRLESTTAPTTAVAPAQSSTKTVSTSTTITTKTPSSSVTTVTTTSAPSSPRRSRESRFPSTLMPKRRLPNPSGRRVSVPAGVVIIPDDHHRGRRYRVTKKRRMLGLRSASHPVALTDMTSATPPPPLPSLALKESSLALHLACRRKSDQAYESTTTFLDDLPPIVFESVLFTQH